jgi:hypothetical protein
MIQPRHSGVYIASRAAGSGSKRRSGSGDGGERYRLMRDRVAALDRRAAR